MSRMRVLAWIVYVGCVDITRPDGTFFVPRKVAWRIARFDGEPAWGEP